MTNYFFTDKPGMEDLYCSDIKNSDGSIVQTGEQYLKIMIERRDSTQVYGNVQQTLTIPAGDVAAPGIPAQQA